MVVVVFAVAFLSAPAAAAVAVTVPVAEFLRSILRPGAGGLV